VNAEEALAIDIADEFAEHANPRYIVGSPDDEGACCFALFGHHRRQAAEAEADLHERTKRAGAHWHNAVYELRMVTSVRRGPDGRITVTRLDEEATDVPDRTGPERQV